MLVEPTRTVSRFCCRLLDKKLLRATAKSDRRDSYLGENA